MSRLMGLITVILLLFQYVNAQTANYNFDFEEWYTDSLAEERLNQWQHIDRDGNLRDWNLHGTQKSTQSYSGNYAATIHRWYMFDRDGLRLQQAIIQKPGYLTGFYKYTSVALVSDIDSTINDIATIKVYFTKWNNVLSHRDTIGHGYQELSTTTAYTPFSCSITYNSADLPDSLYIYIQPSKYSTVYMCKDSSECSFLTIDSFSFSNTTAIDKADAENGMVRIYPNPAKEELIINTEHSIMVQKVYLVDITGRIIMTKEGNIQKINVSPLGKGNYFLKLQTNEGSVVKKVVIE